MKTLLLTITLYNSSGASEKRKYTSFSNSRLQVFYDLDKHKNFSLKYSGQQDASGFVPAVFFVAAQLQVQMFLTQNPNTHSQIPTTRPKHTHTSVCQIHVPKYQIHPPHLLGPGRDATANVPPRLYLPHVRLSNVSALSQLQRFLRLFKTGSLQPPSLVGEHNFATKVFGPRSERVKVRELFHQQSAERRPFLER